MSCIIRTTSCHYETDSEAVPVAQPRAIEDYDDDYSRLSNHRLDDDDDYFGGLLDFGRTEEPTAQDTQRKPVTVQVLSRSSTGCPTRGFGVAELRNVCLYLVL